jgi:uncharacterized SAM-binding protein YcdF (DUF218 family)
VCCAVMLTLVVVVAVAGDRQLRHGREDPLVNADAVVVLGGEHDGREQYGVQLAQTIGAPTVLMSNAYDDDDPTMRAWCGTRHGKVTVICDTPSPPTTRGEAAMAGRYGHELGWHRIVVVTWRYHLPRARLIFSQCYSADPAQVVMRAVPRSYSSSFAFWESIYAYQYAGFVKAALDGPC